MINNPTTDAIENLLKAIEIISAHSIEVDGVDKTVSGVVTGILGSDRYEVTIAGSTYSIPSAIQMSFAERDKVWVTIPSGNFNQKFISGKAV